jgi:hypothetical protein
MISAKTMGRRHYSKRIKADYLIRIDIKWLKKMGVLCKGRYETWIQRNFKIETSISNKDSYLELSYYRKRQGWDRDAWFNCTIPLVSTSCYFGGKRYWFECPIYTRGAFCGKRVAVLYLYNNLFACRHCHNLTYISRNENRCFRSGYWKVIDLSDKIDKIREKMGCSFYAGRPTKKKKQIDKLCNKIVRAYRISTIQERKNFLDGLSPPY